MIFDKIIGHQRQIEVLKNMTFGQSYLFSGPQGVGKKLIAMACAQKILGAPDGRIEKLNHPDLFSVTTDEAFIKIEVIRTIQNFVNLKSFEQKSKVVIIDNAHKMNPQAANALLKTLEEPPENCHFFLITHQKGAMLPTILSRCQKITFGTLTEEEALTLNPVVDDSKKELKQNLLEIFRNLPRSSAYESFESLETLSEEREGALYSALLWHHWIKQTLAVKLGLTASGSEDEVEVFKLLAGQMSSESLLELSTGLLRLESDINANVNRRLAFEQFWLNAREAITREGRGNAH